MRIHRASGFTLIEIVVVLIVLAILATLAFRAPKTATPSVKDIDTIKGALRQLQIRTMADLSGENWYATGTAAEVALFHNGTRIQSYKLSGTTGSFSAAFNSLGQLQTNNSIPAAIAIDADTGYIP